MAVLSFSLTPEATGRVYELLICLAKFGETVSLEARSGKVRIAREKKETIAIITDTSQLTLTALNSSRTAYASSSLDARQFFISYEFNANDASSAGDRFTCQLYNKALQSVFKGGTADIRGRETTVEQCDVSIQDQPDKTACRLSVKMLSKHGKMQSSHCIRLQANRYLIRHYQDLPPDIRIRRSHARTLRQDRSFSRMEDLISSASRVRRVLWSKD